MESAVWCWFSQLVVSPNQEQAFWEAWGKAESTAMGKNNKEKI